MTTETPTVPLSFTVPNNRGLSQTEAQERLAREGPNELSQTKKRTGFTIAWDVLREPMFLLLIGSSVIYAALGDIHEALLMLAMILMVVSITFYQEIKSEKALEALRDLSSPMTWVMRDGAQMQIPSREVVSDDIVLLSEGDRVPADGLLLAGPGLSVDESLLTGESVPVRKAPGQPTDLNDVTLRAGTLVTQGQGLLQVSLTGMKTELGKIGRSLDTLISEESSLQRETGRLVRIFGLWGGFLCVVVLVAYGSLHNDWMHGLLAGITLAMSVLPEEFPMVLTVFMALGAWRIAKSQVLTRRASAIEALGAASILCTDKTGTLTMNRMTIVRLVTADGKSLDWRQTPPQEADSFLSGSFAELLRASALASAPEGLDPMDRGALEAAEKSLPKTDPWRNKPPTPERLYPISKDLLAVTQVWALKPNDSATLYTVAAKGAPETIFSLCALNQAEPSSLMSQFQEMAKSGLRVLGVAKATWEQDATSLPKTPQGFSFQLMGLIGYEDPIRLDVPDAIEACRKAGIRVMMITGDYAETASSIARQIGLENPENTLTGSALEALSEADLAQRVGSVSVFARVKPEQKLKLVNALKANRAIVAMTGDGVNDAPALKSAHIGIAMGQRGTDVAREAAHLVLLQDNFSSIVQAVRLGRRIFDNLRKAMAYIFSIHIPIAGMSLLPVLLNWPLVLFPAHIAFLEMVIDPACALAFEAEDSEADIMNRPPRPLEEPLLSLQTFVTAILQGIAMLLAVLAIYGLSLWRNYPEAEGRTLTFLTMLLCNLMLITVKLSGETSIFKIPFLKNKAYWWVMGGALSAFGVILAVPFLRSLFHFTLTKPLDMMLCLLAAFLYLLLAEILMVFTRKGSFSLSK